jgi:SEFIR domain-containing protein
MTKTSDQAQSEGPTVFLSYARDDEVHASTVLDLANLLVANGIDVELDDWHSGSRRDRYAWVLREIQAADFVIVVASPGYRSVGDGTHTRNLHRGVQAEAAVLRDLVYGDRETWLGRVLPVVLPGRSLDELPAFTQPYSASHFVIDSITDGGVEALLRVLTKQPRHVRPSIGRIPELGTNPSVVSTRPESQSVRANDAFKAVERIAQSLRPRRPDRWTALASAACAFTILALLLIPGLPLIGAMLVGVVGLAMLTVVRYYPRGRGTKAWKIASLLVTPLLAGGAIALPDSWAPMLLETASDSSGAPGYSNAPESGAAGESAQNTLPNGATASGGIGGGDSGAKPGREPSEDEFRQAEGSRAPGAPWQAPTSSESSGQGTVEILAVGHSFTPGIDRITITARNTHSDPVLVKQIEIYMSDWGSGHEWGDEGSWYFVTSGQMYAGTPAYDGTIRTHGLIRMAGSEFSEPLVGQGYVDDDHRSWRRLLTFSPQKFLEGAGTVSIVIDLPTTHLLQLISPGQPPGPIVEQTFDPEKGSLFTRVDLRTPSDSSFACDYLRREPGKPVCDTVDTLASVALPQ